MPRPKDWLEFAHDDLIAAKVILREGCAISTVFYHSQQCAEKSLKAFLSFKSHTILKTHDLVSLLNLCKGFDRDFDTLMVNAYDLNPFASKTRYPDDFYLMPDLTVAQDSIEKAGQIFEFVKGKIS